MANVDTASNKPTINDEKNSSIYAILFLKKKNFIAFNDCPVNCKLILNKAE